MSIGYLADIENDRRPPPSIQIIAKLAAVLDASPDLFCRAALTTRGKLTLSTAGRSHAVAECAYVLAARWDDLTDDEARQIIGVLEANKW